MASDGEVDCHPDWGRGQPPEFIRDEWSMIIIPREIVVIIDMGAGRGASRWLLYVNPQWHGAVSELEARLWLTLSKEEVEQKVRAKS